jgi:acyl-CoA thioester hydrolase
MSAIHRFEFRVPPEAIDGNGHVNNVEYIRWMIAAAHRHAEFLGSPARTRAIGAAWVVRAHWIEYLRPALAGEEVVAETWVSEMRRVQSIRSYRFLRRGDMALYARGRTEWVFVHAGSGKPRAIPPEIKSLFPVLPDDALGHAPPAGAATRPRWPSHGGNTGRGPAGVES